MNKIILFSKKKPYGNELIINGTFDTDTSDWVAYRGAIISSVNGRLNLQNGGGIASGCTEQYISTEIGKTYNIKASFYKNNVSANLRIGTTSQALNIAYLPVTESTDFDHNFEALTTTTYISLFNTGGNDGNLSEWDNVSVKEVL